MVRRTLAGPPGLSGTARVRRHLQPQDGLHCGLFPEGRSGVGLIHAQDRLLAEALSRMGDGPLLVVEPWPSALPDRARRVGRAARWATRGSLPALARASLEGALLLESVQWARDRGTLLRAVRDALAQGGRLVVADLLARDPRESARTGLSSLPDLRAELLEMGFAVLDERLFAAEVAPTFRELAEAAEDGASAGEAGMARDLRRFARWSRDLLAALESGACDYAVMTLRRETHRVRGLLPGDDAALSGLFERCFGSARSAEEWRWRWRRQHPAASVAVDDTGAPVAYYGGHPTAFRLHGPGGVRRLTAIHVGDTMTDPGVRSLGRRRTHLLARASSHFFARQCQGRVDFNYGFNRGAIQRFSLRLPDAAFVSEVGWWRLEVAGSALERPAPAWAGWPTYSVACVHSVGPDWDALLARAGPAYGFLAERDANYARWRFLERPGDPYEVFEARLAGALAAWAVFRREADRLVWGDALVDPAQPLAARALLRAAVTAAPAPATRVEAWFSSRPEWWCRLIEEIGFRSAPEPDGLGMVYRPFGSERFDDALRDRLYFTMADGDLF